MTDVFHSENKNTR